MDEVERPGVESWEERLVNKYRFIGQWQRFKLRLSRKRKKRFVVWGLVLGLLIGAAGGIAVYFYLV